MARTSPPSLAMTRATLTPPPPGSRRTDVLRSLCVGTTRATSAEMSMAGFMVRVTMLIIVSNTPLLQPHLLDRTESGV
jgi:hypothetical protein